MSALALLAGCSTSQETYAVATASAGSAVAVATARVVGAPAPAAPPAASPSAVSPQAAPSASERYPEASANPMVRVAEAPVSTFSVDVDTSAYSQVRRALREGRMPRPEAVRVEELVNYFDYAYPAPADRAAPFQTMVGVVPTPWNPRTRLMQIGLRGYDVPRDARPRANLVFLVDTSGSMDEPDRMPLVKQTLGHLIDQLGPQDRVAIVTYAGASAVALPPTAGSERERIRAVVDGLNAYGSTAGGAGIQTAYELAEKSFDREAVNRVILATDGDFNVGVSDPKELERIITEKRRSGVYLTALGYGTGNLNEAILQRLAQAGNGNAAYVDSALEARRVMVDELSSTLFPIADDVKVQV
ncbi:MAG TPA: von Willebrand factor type A domain-containing protein, partial [Alphaproteobacteria bacterium]|nr:von Willebrand factor type A domain-containing protein [Alphaproteobacteria bacterium]